MVSQGKKMSEEILTKDLKNSDKLNTNDKSIIFSSLSDDTKFEPLKLDNRSFAMSNNAILGCQPMTLVEGKLFRILLSQITFFKDEKTLEYEMLPYRIKVQDLAKKLNLKGNSLYNQVQDVCISLTTRHIFAKKNDEWEVYTLMSYVKYKKGVVELKLNNDLKDFVYGLGEYFSIYQLESILSFRSKHSLRIYEAIKAKIGQNKSFRTMFNNNETVHLSITDKELRDITATIHKYKQTYDFKKNVITPALKEITNISDINVTYDIDKNPQKKGDLDLYFFEISNKASYSFPNIYEIFKSSDIVTEDYIKKLLFATKKEKDINHIEEIRSLVEKYVNNKDAFDKNFIYALNHSKYSLTGYILSIPDKNTSKNPDFIKPDPLTTFDNDESSKIFYDTFDEIFNYWNKLANENIISDTHGIEHVKYKTKKSQRLLKNLLDEGISPDEIKKGIHIANESLYFLNNHNSFSYFLNAENFKSIMNNEEKIDSTEQRF
ncbi:MAG: hypothetical protein CVU99_06755 [Firmicutes bacterium HGW-Firmicutes-4]|jgi:plasmid replication initiation protein|nr:MAG: hypothetical protein CVU99_06755 [Firmicutes bacterium HGW-Firmicutes-4]